MLYKEQKQFARVGSCPSLLIFHSLQVETGGKAVLYRCKDPNVGYVRKFAESCDVPRSRATWGVL